MIVVGDVHGCYKTLMELMKILPQTKDICFVGDLIDRGTDSKKVIKFVRDNKYKCVLGNHEYMAISNSDYIYDTWIMNGGRSTIKNYGSLEAFKQHSDYQWMVNLPILIRLNIQNKEYIVSHSFCWKGGNTEVYDILWGRQFFIDKCKEINIFGHTPMKEVTKIANKHWCIDTGCVFNYKLSAVDLTTNKFYSVLNKENK